MQALMERNQEKEQAAGIESKGEKKAIKGEGTMLEKRVIKTTAITLLLFELWFEQVDFARLARQFLFQDRHFLQKGWHFDSFKGREKEDLVLRISLSNSDAIKYLTEKSNEERGPRGKRREIRMLPFEMKTMRITWTFSQC